MAIPFLKGIDVAGAVDLSNLKIGGAQGTDGQVLTSTGSGIAWEDAAAGTSETAERIEVTVKNVSGGSLSKGTVVHASPSATPPSGNVIEVIAADYDDPTKMPAIGILNETIANEGEGSAVMMGAVSGIDTSSFSIGDELYVGNLGALQNSKPTTAGQLIQKIAVVIKSHASNGLIKIFGAGRSNDVPLPLYIDNTNQRVGISDPNPAEKLVVSEVRTGSTASDLYTTVVKSVQSAGASPNPGTGGLKVQYTSSSSNVHAFGLVAGSSSSDFLTTGPMHFYTNSDLDTVSATGFAMQLDTSQRLILGSMTASQKLNVSGNVTADRYYGNGSTVYYVDPNNSTTAAVLAGGLEIGYGSNGEYRIEVGEGRTGNGYAYIDFTGDTTYSDYGLRLIRNNSGANTSSQLLHRGTGTLNFKNLEAAHMTFDTSNTERMRIESGGNVGIGTNNPGYKLDVSGTAKADEFVSLVNASNSGITRDWTIIGTGDRGAGLQVNDISGAKYAIYAGGYDLTFGKHVSSNNTYTTAMAIYAADAIDSSPYVQATHSLRAPIFYDSNNTGYFMDLASSSVAIDMNGYIYQANESYDIDGSRANAIYQATRATQTDRGTWPATYMYAVNFGDRTKGIQLASRYSGANELYFRTGTDNSSSENGANTWKNWRQLYHVDYHPEADTWTTARTITIGSTGKSVDGSGNVSWTLAEIGAQAAGSYAAAGDENIIDGALSIWNADGDGDVFTYNDANPTHNGDQVGAVINIKGDGAEFGSLVRAGQYTADHVSVSRGYYVGAALNTTDSTTQKVIDSVGNIIVGPDTVDIKSGTISVGGDANTYYPVVWYYNTQSQAFLNRIQIYRNYNETAPNSWNTSTHKGGLLLDLQANWGGWGGVNYDIKVNEFSETYSNMVGKISHFANSRGFAIWLRGGTATYHFYTEGPQANPTVQLSAYDPGNNSTGVSSITSLDTANINNRLYFRSGTLYSQNSQVLTVANEGSGNGIDADTVDGIQGGSFLRSDANDSFTGSELHFPTLDLSISNNNAQNQGNTYFRGTGTHFVLGLNNGNTCYLNYGNTSGALRLYGSSIYWNDSNIGAPWGSGNDGSGSGLDADTVDGIQGGSFLRSDANDTATGQITINTSGNALTVTSQQSIGAIITGGNNSQDIIQLKKGTDIEAKLDTSGNWHVDADVIAYSTSISSDKKLKTNISTLTDALDKTIKLRGVNFDWIDENKPNNQVGFIAQEVEKVLPEVVKNVETLNKENETHKAVDYAAVVPLLVEAIKEQQKQIDELKSIINGSS